MDNIRDKVKRLDAITDIRTRTAAFIEKLQQENSVLLASENPVDTKAKEALQKLISDKQAHYDSFKEELREINYYLNRLSIDPADYRTPINPV